MKKKVTLPIKRLNFMLNGAYAGSHLMVKIKINGMVAKLIIDTGASSSVLNSTSFDRFRNKHELKDTETKSTTASGFVQGQYTFLRKIEFGNICLKPFQIGTMDISHLFVMYNQMGIKEIPDGVIGADLLIMLKAVIDVNKSKLILSHLSKQETFNFTEAMKSRMEKPKPTHES